VAGKLSSAGGLKPSYLNQLSEIQLQDEAYIHEQLGVADPEDCERQVDRLRNVGLQHLACAHLLHTSGLPVCSLIAACSIRADIARSTADSMHPFR